MDRGGAASPTGPPPMTAIGRPFFPPMHPAPAATACSLSVFLLIWKYRAAATADQPSDDLLGLSAPRFDGGIGLGRAAFGARAAVLAEIGEERLHAVEPGGIDHRPTGPAHADEAGVAQPVEMKGEGVGREPERGRHLTRGGRPARRAPAAGIRRADCL